MTRNELIRMVGKKIDELRLYADTSTAWAKVGELEQFANDLCNAPTAHNRKSGAICYTMKEAAIKWRSIVRVAPGIARDDCPARVFAGR